MLSFCLFLSHLILFSYPLRRGSTSNRSSNIYLLTLDVITAEHILC
jgi:hypothetical protein